MSQRNKSAYDIRKEKTREKRRIACEAMGGSVLHIPTKKRDSCFLPLKSITSILGGNACKKLNEYAEENSKFFATYDDNISLFGTPATGGFCSIDFEFMEYNNKKAEVSIKRHGITANRKKTKKRWNELSELKKDTYFNKNFRLDANKDEMEFTLNYKPKKTLLYADGGVKHHHYHINYKGDQTDLYYRLLKFFKKNVISEGAYKKIFDVGSIEVHSHSGPDIYSDGIPIEVMSKSVEGFMFDLSVEEESDVFTLKDSRGVKVMEVELEKKTEKIIKKKKKGALPKSFGRISISSYNPNFLDRFERWLIEQLKDDENKKGLLQERKTKLNLWNPNINLNDTARSIREIYNKKYDELEEEMIKNKRLMEKMKKKWEETGWDFDKENYLKRKEIFEKSKRRIDHYTSVAGWKVTEKTIITFNEQKQKELKEEMDKYKRLMEKMGKKWGETKNKSDKRLYLKLKRKYERRKEEYATFIYLNELKK